MVINVHAIILERQPMGEADRLLTAFTLERGRMRLVAKGVRRPLSTLKASVELFTSAALLVVEGRSLHNVTEGRITESFPTLRAHLPRVLTAHHLAETVRRLTVEEDPNPAVYHLLADALHALDTQTPPPRLLLEAFRMQLLGAIGFAPELRRCVHCEKDIPEGEHWFSPSAEGLECDGCRKADALPLSATTLKLLRHFERGSLTAVSRVALPEAERRAVRTFTQRMIELHTERELKSTRFLEG